MLTIISASVTKVDSSSHPHWTRMEGPVDIDIDRLPPLLKVGRQATAGVRAPGREERITRPPRIAELRRLYGPFRPAQNILYTPRAPAGRAALRRRPLTLYDFTSALCAVGLILYGARLYGRKPRAETVLGFTTATRRMPLP
ncbi:hypothetical protein EVAR_63349_1 [Eumeta japonica]|uniref:Uncharacterized protein n=1 Tax=Eumeta variegata TaxID=151549 RepID=A0A4C2AEF0_EUMVA|nr:hypothetical protein EVAR_63349_1 [Eumeta japonica]